jgi:hypothetical protein
MMWTATEKWKVKDFLAGGHFLKVQLLAPRWIPEKWTGFAIYVLLVRVI